MRLLTASLLLLPLYASAPSAQIGRPLPEVEVEDFALTEARSMTDLTGRAVLIEFFAYW